MIIHPLAADSLGVRSMATFVQVGTTGILIDPGATLAPARFGLPPAEEEWEALRRANDRISAWAGRAQLVFVSHYHDDHFRSDPATYAGRQVLAKDPRRAVPARQAQRGTELWAVLRERAPVAGADGAAWTEGPARLTASPPLPHGPEGTPLGWVVALTVEDAAERQRFVFASDVQGPLSPVAAAWIARQRPTLLYLSGPPTYLEHELGAAVIEQAIDHLRRIIETTGCRVIVDHHACRDPRGAERLARLWETGRAVTAAGYCGQPEAGLEARRRQLWTRVRKPAGKAAPARPAAAPGPRRTIHLRKGGTPT